MDTGTAELIVSVLGLYLALGLIFAIGFVSVGLSRVDPNAEGVKTSVRLLFIPGTVALWPLLIVHWFRGGIPARERRTAD